MTAPKGVRFDWQLASVFGTALWTTLLATATGWLAWSTRSEVRATQDLAELTRRDQAARERPVVLVEWVTFSGSPPNGAVEVMLRNAGIGPALRVRVRAVYEGHADWKPSIEPGVMTVLDAGDRKPVQVRTTFPEPYQAGGVRDAFRADGDYLDRSMQNTYEIITSWPDIDVGSGDR